MIKNQNSSLQEWLIAFVLLCIVPVTVWLGIETIAPKVDNKTYYAAQDAWYKEHKPENNVEKNKERYQEWKKTDVHVQHERAVCVNFFYHMMIGNAIAIVLFYIGSTFVMPVVAAALIFSGIIVYCSSGWGTNITCPIVFDLNMRILKMIFIFLSLLILVWFAYKDSQDS